MNLDELDADDLLGAVRHRGRWRYYSGKVAEWLRPGRRPPFSC